MEKSSTKTIALVDKIHHMLQSQIVVKELGNQIDTKDPLYIKYAITGFHFIAWMIIFVNVTIYRNAAILQRHENNHCITRTKLLRRCM
jgi:hypothetical protein